MSTYTVGSVIDTCRKRILDEGSIDFDDPEILNLFNLTSRKMVTLLPRVHTRIRVMQLQAGNKQIIPQTAPTVGLEIIDVIRNMGLTGLVPGRSIRQTDRAMITRYVPTFSTDAANADSSIWDWWPIPEYPEQFYVHPQSDGNGFVEIEQAEVPPDIVFDAGGAWRSIAIPVSDYYLDGYINGILYQAYDDDTDIPGNTPRSQLYYQRFLVALGMQQEAPPAGGQA